MDRRTFLGALAAAPAVFGAEDSSEAQQKAILARIRPPKFPSREFDATKSASIQKAVDACAAAGGGRVVVPPGDHKSGPIHLKSDVELHVSAGATIFFSNDPKHYPNVFTRWEGIECMNFSPLIYAWEARNIAVTGKGTLDGQSSREHWWAWKGNAKWKTAGFPTQDRDRESLFEMAEKNVPVEQRVFGLGHYLRPNFLQPYRSQNVLIEDITIRNSPMWEIHPVLCKNVTVRNVTIDSHGPNNDGCDPESCTDFLIEGCTFDTGDDCIALNSGRNADGRRIGVPCENVIVRNCTMKDGHGGVAIGSQISGGVRNVFISDCRMSSPNLERALRIKTNAMRGGVLENIWFQRIEIGEVATDAIQIDFYYEEAEKGPFKPVVRDIHIADVTCRKSNDALNFRGFASAPIRDVSVSHCRFDNAAKPNVFEHVEGLTLTDVVINGKKV